MEELRAGWEVPSIAHYCEIFRKPFRLPEFDVDELEEAFIASGSPDGSTLLTQLFIQLLKGCYPHKGITEPSYIRWLHNLCKCNGYERELPFTQDFLPEAFYTVPQKDKVDLLYMLCHVRLNSNDVSDLLKGYDGDYLRLEPIGMDGSGAIYWYFDDTRLYKEDPPPKRTAARKKAAGRKTPNKAQSACPKTQPKPRKQSQRQSRSLGNVANTKGSNSAKSTPERTTRLRTRSVHNLRATRSRVSSDVQSDSSDQSPLRKRVKIEADTSIGTQKTEPDNKNANTSENPTKDSPVDGITPRRSSRTRSATSWYQYEMGKVKKVEPSDPQSSSDSDSDSGVTLAQVTVTGDMSDNGAGRWHLACVTVEDWTVLAQQFHKSSVACERKLCRRLMNDLIPLVQSRYEQKEKLRRKKLLEVAPRRTSGRLEVKRHLQEEETNRWDQHGPNPYDSGECGRRRRNDEDLNLNLEEMERKQKEEREREREKARQERIRRVELRELRASLIAQGKDIPPELFGTPHQESNSESDDSSQEELMNAMSRVLSLVRQRRDAWPFRHPVDEEFAPNYRVVIQCPMDLETMEKKLRNGEYIYRDQFAADLSLIFDNCRKYNGPVNDYTHLANKLEEFVKRVMEKYLPDKPESSSSEEDEDSIDDSSSDDDSYQQNRDASGGSQFQTLKHVPTQRWTSSLSRSSLSTAAAPSLTQPRRPCYAASYAPRKTPLPQGASTIITIRRIPDSTPPGKFYASHNISSSEQRGLVKKFPGNLAEIAAKHGPGKYQIVAVPADGFITDVSCMAVPKTSAQNTVVTNNQDTNRHKLVTVDSSGQSRTSGLLTTAVKVVPTQTVSVSVQPVSLLTSTSTTQTFQATSQGRSVVTDHGATGQVSNPKGVGGTSAGRPLGGVSRVVDSQGGQRVVVTSLTHPVSVTSESRLSPASRVLTNSCQAPAAVQRIPHTLPRPPVVPGQSLKPLADHGQQKSLVNGQVTGSPKTILVTNGQSYPKSPNTQGTKGGEMTVKPTVANTSSCVVTPVSSRVSTVVSSSST